jgi:Tol biopolymer transport system component
MRTWVVLAIAAVSTSQPEIFAPGIVSGIANAGSPTFTPDGRTMYFTRSGGRWSVIVESHRVGDRWSQPQVAPFSGEWSDQQPAMAPDGSFLVFVSVRQHVANLWRVERQGSEWSAPVRLPDAVNVGTSVWRPSVARDGSVYFFVIGKDDKGRTMRLYHAPCDHGQYLPAMPLPFSSGATADVDPEIAPDESFIVFASAGRSAADDSHEHLFVAHRQGTDWGPVTRVAYEGLDANADDNEPRLGPDRRTLYFSSNRSLPVTFPRSREQAVRDAARLAQWDNGNNNVWSLEWLVD